MCNMCDVIVVGGSIKGCFTAIYAAKAGAKVVLIEPGTFLGTEITSTLRPWLGYGGFHAMEADLKKVFFQQDDIKKPEYGRDEESNIPVYIGAIKKNLLAMLQESGVTVLFLTEIAGILKAGGAVGGILIGGKWGLYLLRTKAVIDTTGDKRAVRMTGAASSASKQKVVVGRVIEYYRLKHQGLVIEVPESLCIHNSSLTLHPGKKYKNQYFVDFGMEMAIGNGSYEEIIDMEIQSRLKTIEIAAYLRKHVPGFAQASLFQTSQRLYIPEVTSIDGNNSTKHEGFAEMDEYSNLYFCTKKLELPLDPSCEDITRIIGICEKMGKHLASKVKHNILYCPAKKLVIATGRSQTAIDMTSLASYEDAGLKIELYPVDIAKLEGIPSIGHYDVLVAGGGTSGAPAAAAAARQGAKTALVEAFWDLGGTKTIGQVRAYYTGYRGGYTRELDLKIKELSGVITGLEDENHTESRMMVNLKEILDYRGRVFLGSTVVGAVMEGSVIRGACLLNSDGLCTVSCTVAVDASGDGDLAISAGAGYSYGSKRDGYVQTFNQNGYIDGSFNDLGIVDGREMYDFMRGISIAHQRNDNYDFCPFLAVRESRRIAGDYELTMADIYQSCCYDDTISVAQTDCDPHGSNSSLLARLGYMPLRSGLIKSFLPYRICLPKGVEGLLIAAKALSATKDASQFFRMSADMQNLGYAIGTAAALAINHKVLPRDINIKDLQQILRQKGILPKDVSIGTLPKSITDSRLVEALREGRREELLQVFLLRDTANLKPLLEKSLDTADAEGKLLISMALAWCGSRLGTQVLMNELNRLFILENHALHDDIHPDEEIINPIAGFIGFPDTYWKINQLIVLLGIAYEKKAAEMLNRIAAETVSGGEPYRISPAYMHGSIRTDWQRIPHYDRIYSLCTALERIAEPSAIPGLTALLEKPNIGGYVSKEDIYAGGRFVSAHLEIIIARTLARCGGKKGAMVLADYTDDVQIIFSRHAYSELKDITGQDFGRTSAGWKEWITGQKDFPIKPYIAKHGELLS